MLYHVHMIVNIPADLDPEYVAKLKQTEKEYSQQLQRDGVWVELWRIVGEYANYSIFDAPSNDHLHEILSSLPLFPYMKITVTPLARHTSRI